jgi:Animal haem peroxidase
MADEMIMTRRNLLRLGLGAAGTVVLLRGGGRALAGPASAAVGASPAPGQPAAMFGRMFPKLAPFRPDGTDEMTSLANLAELADSMLEPGGGVDTTHGALYTYFAQFIDHDITLDLEPQPTADFSFAKPNARSPLLDPGGNTVFDYESKKLNLSQIYGGGPSVSPQLYASDGLHFLVPANVNGVIDLPRRADGSAILVELRNDENQILSQFHVAMLLFHNNLVDALGMKNFTRAMNMVIKYYQWAILHDFLPLFCGQAVIDAMLAGKGRVYDPGAKVAQPIMPIEFSTAAYRFGHSLVRNAYSVNPVISPGNKNARNTLFAGVGGATGPAGGTGQPLTPVGDLHGGYPLTLDHQIDWRNFSEDLFDITVPGASLQVLKQPGGGDGLHSIGQSMFGQPPGVPAAGSGAGMPIGGPSGVQPSGSNSIQYRDFIRGFFYQLPSGQDVATAYGLTPVDPAEAIPSSIPGFSAGTPLFQYVLYEAFLANQGSPVIDNFDATGTTGDFTLSGLGPVGARIVADVLLRLMRISADGVFANGFSPAEPIAQAAGQFRVSDLLRFAGVVPSGANPAPSLGQNAGPQPS